MLSRGLGRDFFVQDSADWTCGEECCAKRLVRLERISNLKEARFSTIAVRFGSFEFLSVLVNLRCSRKRLPSPGLYF
jgi:hypothetical protein